MSKSLKRAMWTFAALALGLYGLYRLQAPLSKAGWSEIICALPPPKHVLVKVGPDCSVPDMAALDVHMGARPHQRMIWTLAATGGARWTFAPNNGIELKDPAADPGQVVFYARLRESDKVYRWCNANSDRGVYEYKVNLVGPEGRTCVIDPFIHNHN